MIATTRTRTGHGASLCALALCVAVLCATAIDAKSCGGCSKCLAQDGADVSNGITDSDCSVCPSGYEFWPCASGKCYCAEEKKKAPASAPAPAPAPAPAAPSTTTTAAAPAAATNTPTTTATTTTTAAPVVATSTPTTTATTTTAAPGAATNTPTTTATTAATTTTTAPAAPPPAPKVNTDVLDDLIASATSTVSGASCKAVKDSYRRGISNADCKRCEEGYRWWPCNTDGCVCSDSEDSKVTAKPAEKEEKEPAREKEPATSSVATPAATSFDPASLARSVSASATTEKEKEASAYAAVADWGQCGGKTHACGSDKACAPCKSPSFACLSDSEWYYQCRPGAAARAVEPLPDTEEEVTTAAITPIEEEEEKKEVSAYAAVPDWGQCGGKGHACGMDKACAPCQSPSFACLSDSEWYYQCRPGAAAGAVEPLPAPAPPAPEIATEEEVTTAAATPIKEKEEVEVEAAVLEKDLPAVVLPPAAEENCDQGDISRIITKDDWEDLFPYRNDPACKSSKNPDGSQIEGGFYEYDDFVAAARRFPCFLGSGSDDDKKKEAAAFLAQISHETTGGWATAPGGAQR